MGDYITHLWNGLIEAALLVVVVTIVFFIPTEGVAAPPY